MPSLLATLLNPPFALRFPEHCPLNTADCHLPRPCFSQRTSDALKSTGLLVVLPLPRWPLVVRNNAIGVRRKAIRELRHQLLAVLLT